MKRHPLFRIATSTALAAVLLAAAAPRAQNAYRVIVHPSNPLSSITKAELSALFLKKVTTWPNGEQVEPVDLKVDEEVREIFTREVHGKTVAAVKSYWTQKIFSGRDVPPVEKASERDVIAFIKENPAAVGYISDTAPAEGVKAVQVK